MIKKTKAIAILLLTLFFSNAQKRDSIPDLSKGNYVITNLAEDTVSYRDKASQTLRTLKNGAVVVRLKTNQKNIDAYRKAGKDAIADRIEEDRRKQNEKMYEAFERNFHFCKVFFIYANETDDFLRGKKVFLKKGLEHDPSITFNDTNFIFCEYGSVESFSKFQDYEHPSPNTGGTNFDPRIQGKRIFDTVPTQTSTSPATTSGLFFSDKTLNQLHRPFPFVAGVYMENYDAPVRTLDRELERAYQRLVVAQDFKTEMKAQRKKDKQKRKSEPRYNPFK